MAYPLIPSAFLVELASNGASNIIDTQPNLLSYLQVFLNGGTNPDGYTYVGALPALNPQLAGGDWSVVWGPCVYCVEGTSKPTTATNAMYVAYSKTLDTYLVGIAATNAISAFDWIFEDAFVDPHYAAAWPPKLPFVATRRAHPYPQTTPAISAATALGISNLLTQPEMVDPVGGNLQTFLKSKVNAKSTLIFGGHSLAGALSPTLAFYLYPQPAKAGWKEILVLPTAGATPGNQGFAQAFAQAFPQQTDPSSKLFWNTDYANHYDVVPHAWDKLHQVITGFDLHGNWKSIWGVLQGHKPGGGVGIGTIIRLALAAAEKLSDGYYVALTQQWFTPNWGYWQWNDLAGPPVWTKEPTFTDTSPLSTLDQLGQVVDATHIDQYFNFFGVVPPPKMQTPPLKRQKTLGGVNPFIA